MSRVALIVPCYNEAERLDSDAFSAWLGHHPDVSMIFVNDGSTDRTLEVLTTLAERTQGRASVLDLRHNQGKAEVVRRGLLHALADAPDAVGFIDADLATPLDELDRLISVLDGSDIQVVMGARVSLLGRRIERNGLRHYLGRVFASTASLTLKLRVYDTQCGAKLFRPSPALEAALSVPFLSRWVFDVELLGRMMHPGKDIRGLLPEDIVEEPLRAWRDVPGSKLNPVHMLRSAVDLLRIAIELRHLRNRD